MFSMNHSVHATLLDKCLTITVIALFAANPVYIKCEQTVTRLQMMDLATPLRAFPNVNGARGPPRTDYGAVNFGLM